VKITGAFSLGLFIFLLFAIFIGIGLALFGFLINEFIVLVVGLAFALLFCFPLVLHLHGSCAAKKIIKARESAPAHSASAKVFSKTSQIIWGLVSFELSDGSRKNFRVSIEDFNLISESESGTLTYKEYENQLLFIGFQAQF